MKECTWCNTEIPDNEEMCETCKKLSEEMEKEDRGLQWWREMLLVGAIVLFFGSGCGGLSSKEQTQTESLPPTQIEGIHTHPFDETELFAFLLKVFYPGASQSYFTHPDISDTFQCPQSGAMTSVGYLDIQTSGWNGEIAYTFEACTLLGGTTITGGPFSLAFDGPKYLGVGSFTLNERTCSMKLEGDWEVDEWSFCNNYFHITATL